MRSLRRGTLAALFLVLALTPWLALAEPPPRQAASRSISTAHFWPQFHHDAQHTGRSQHALPAGAAVSWQFRPATGSITAPVVVGVDGTVYFAAGGYVHAVGSDGTSRWRRELGTLVGMVALDDFGGSVYVTAVVGTDHFLYELRTDGTEVWRLVVPGGSVEPSRHLAIDIDGTILMAIGSTDGALAALYAVDGITGDERWSLPIPYVRGSSPAIGYDGTVYLGAYTSGGRLHAIEPSGDVLWDTEELHFVNSSPSIGDDGTIYVGSSTGLYAINNGGLVRWHLPTTVPINLSSPANRDATVYVGVGDELVAVNTATGVRQWGSPCLAGGMIATAPLIGSDGAVLIHAVKPGAAISAALCVFESNGSLRWMHPTQTGGLAGPLVSSPAVGPDGRIFVASPDGVLHALTSGDPGFRTRLPLVRR